jgi:hypothetical protein
VCRSALPHKATGRIGSELDYHISVLDQLECMQTALY